MADQDRCAISVEGDEGYIRCSNRATGRGLCEEHLGQLAEYCGIVLHVAQEQKPSDSEVSGVMGAIRAARVTPDLSDAGLVRLMPQETAAQASIEALAREFMAKPATPPTQGWLSPRAAREVGIPDDAGELVEDEHGWWRRLANGESELFIAAEAPAPKPSDYEGVETRKPSDERTQSINVTGPGKPGHQIDGAGEKDLGQGPVGGKA